MIGKCSDSSQSNYAYIFQVEVVVNNASFVDFIENDMSKDAREVKLSCQLNFNALSDPHYDYILLKYLH